MKPDGPGLNLFGYFLDQLHWMSGIHQSLTLQKKKKKGEVRCAHSCSSPLTPYLSVYLWAECQLAPSNHSLPNLCLVTSVSLCAYCQMWASLIRPPCLLQCPIVKASSYVSARLHEVFSPDHGKTDH